MRTASPPTNISKTICRAWPEMPRKRTNKRLEILLSPEQHQALKEEVKTERKRAGEEATHSDMAAYVRSVLAWAIPAFGRAKPLVERGKYARRKAD